ncbi:MAG TPA: sulfurtransferase TusA family protein [Bacillales bacterium]
MEIKTNHVLDAKGLSCPMPIVKTKKEMSGMEPGQVIEVQATDKGSIANIQAWAKSTGEQYLGTVQEKDTLKHYLRKSDPEETKEETKYPHTASLKDLKEKLDDGEKITVVDVREPAEYAFGHIPGAKSIPLGELEDHLNDLKQDDNIHVICRTGHRSDYAAQKMAEKGFEKVINVVPGMAEWDGPVEKQEGGHQHE